MGYVLLYVISTEKCWVICTEQFLLIFDVICMGNWKVLYDLYLAVLGDLCYDLP